RGAAPRRHHARGKAQDAEGHRHRAEDRSRRQPFLRWQDRAADELDQRLSRQAPGHQGRRAYDDGGVGAAANNYANFFTASTALSPPNANEFDSAASIASERAVFGT